MINLVSKSEVEQKILIDKISELYDPKNKEKLKNELTILPSLTNDLIDNIQKLAPDIKEKMKNSYEEYLKEKVEKD